MQAHVLLTAPTGAEPPRDFRIFGNGITRTTKGSIVFDDIAAKDVMAAFADSGMDQLPFDVGHGMLSLFSPPEGHAAFGWFKPSVRGGALWASDISWTEKGAAAIRNREFRYFSPAIEMDEGSRRVQKLINIALTNLPATKDQQPLAASLFDATTPPARVTTLSADERDVCTALGITEAAFAESKKTIATSLQSSGLTADERAVCVQLGMTEDAYLTQKILDTAADLNRTGRMPRDEFEVAVMKGMIRR